jgi:hypothetical protein
VDQLVKVDMGKEEEKADEEKLYYMYSEALPRSG